MVLATNPLVLLLRRSLFGVAFVSTVVGGSLVLLVSLSGDRGIAPEPAKVVALGSDVAVAVLGEPRRAHLRALGLQLAVDQTRAIIAEIEATGSDAADLRRCLERD